MENEFLISPFQWRYGSKEMRSLWSEENKRLLWRKVWYFLLRAFCEVTGTKVDLKNVLKKIWDLDISKSTETEREFKHDLFAELKTFADQLGKDGQFLHFGATSYDVEDNADALRFYDATKIVLKKLVFLCDVLADLSERYKSFTCLGYTHLQPAQPTTLGHRFAYYLQDLIFEGKALDQILRNFRVRGLRGAVGTSASWCAVFGKKKFKKLEKLFLRQIGFKAFEISSQIQCRKLEQMILQILGGVASTIHKIALDIRILSSFGEVFESYQTNRIGSSAMPFKKNPSTSEQICSLCRHLILLVNNHLMNSSLNALERTLDDSANRRIFIPECFLIIDHVLDSVSEVLQNIVVNTEEIQKNLKYHCVYILEPLKLFLTLEGYGVVEAHSLSRQISDYGLSDVQKILDIAQQKFKLSQESARKLKHLGFNPERYIGLIEEYIGNVLTSYKTWKDKLKI
ncbi:MAG: lyase family protein [Deltaproteobacteria bacterium]|nr:lyase family protein [Deltaproteobacteria bacterium]